MEINSNCIPLAQPPLRRGSHSFLICPNPLIESYYVDSANLAVSEIIQSESITHLLSRSPVMLVGPSGVGKTTLAASIAARWIHDEANRNVTMTSATEFSKMLNRAIKADDMHRFRQVHRECDCLVVDNVHELATKPAAQDELICVMDRLEDAGSLVILTMQDLPSLVPGLKPNLVSRIAGGHTVRIEYPNRIACRSILRELASQSKFDISDSELDQIAAQVGTGTSALQLRGILIRWNHQKINDSTLNNNSTRVIDRIVDSQSMPCPSAHEIAKGVSRETKVSLELLTGQTRKSSIVRARGLAMLLIRQLTGDSYENIGSYFGGRDHTTVMHACKKTEADIQHDIELGRITDRIRQRYRRQS